MSAVTTRLVLETLLTTEQELNALPDGAVVLADPEGLLEYEYSRRMPMKKLDYAYGQDSFWEPSHGEAITSSEAVGRWRLGSFLVIWLPPAVESL